MNILEWSRKKYNKPGPKSVPAHEVPTAYVTRVIPATGKSTIAKHMMADPSFRRSNRDRNRRKGAPAPTRTGVGEVNFDKIREREGRHPAYFGPELNQQVSSDAKENARQGKHTVHSNTTIPGVHARAAIQQMRDAGYERVKPITLPTSTKAAMRRNRRRTGTVPGSSSVPQGIMNRMARGFSHIPKAERKEMEQNYKELHRTYRFTKPAMRRSGAIGESKTFEDFLTEARAATRATVRGRRLDPGATQRAVARADRRAEALDRAKKKREREEQERLQNQQYVELRKANPEILRKEAQKRTLASRMASAAKRLGLDEAKYEQGKSRQEKEAIRNTRFLHTGKEENDDLSDVLRNLSPSDLTAERRELHNLERGEKKYKTLGNRPSKISGALMRRKHTLSDLRRRALNRRLAAGKYYLKAPGSTDAGNMIRKVPRS